MTEMRRYTVAGEEWLLLADVCEEIGVGRELATEPLLLAMITPEDRRSLRINGVDNWAVTDAGAFDLASIVPPKDYKRKHKPGRKRGHTLDRAIFRQIYRFYRLEILNGVYVEGDALPSTKFMKAQWGAFDEKAVWRGRKMLERDGFVTITRGRGSRAIVSSEYKQRQELASGVIQVGRRYTTQELEDAQ